MYINIYINDYILSRWKINLIVFCFAHLFQKNRTFYCRYVYHFHIILEFVYNISINVHVYTVANKNKKTHLKKCSRVYGVIYIYICMIRIHSLNTMCTYIRRTMYVHYSGYESGEQFHIKKTKWINTIATTALWCTCFVAG